MVAFQHCVPPCSMKTCGAWLLQACETCHKLWQHTAESVMDLLCFTELTRTFGTPSHGNTHAVRGALKPSEP